MTDYTVTTSSELMQNFMQSDFLSPQDKFTALQTEDGSSLLFSIGSDGAFFLTAESIGQTNGWQRHDLGSARINVDFSSSATVKNFAAAQRTDDTTVADIHLAMIVSDGTNDHLYLSLNNSSTNTKWFGNPSWIAVPFNATKNDGAKIAVPSPFSIVNVFISEAKDHDWIVVDILRDAKQKNSPLTRFVIDITANSQTPSWSLHDLAIDIQADAYQSCLGRSSRAFGVDGLYTKGKIDGSAQLIYTPLYNVFDRDLRPLPSRLFLPGGLVADAITAVRNSDQSTDLFAAAKQQLFYFSSTNQSDQAVALPLLTSPLLATARSLWSYVTAGLTIVWGLNSENNVFYVTCPVGQSALPQSWTQPIPILTQVDAVTPFVNRIYSANTFFAHRGQDLLKVTKSPTTALWNTRVITLAPDHTTSSPPRTFSSYTTHLQVNDAAGKPAANVPVTLTATNVTSVYINHLYYIISPTPITLTTDDSGSLTVVEATSSLTATQLQVKVASTAAISINTMDTAWERNTQYITGSSLAKAQIVDRHGNKRNLVPAGTSVADINSVAAANSRLAEAYAQLKTEPTSDAYQSRTKSTVQANALSTGAADIFADIGDLLSWIASGVEAAVDVIYDGLNDVWYFVAGIAGCNYRAILDTVEAIVEAATWVYSKIKVVAEDLLALLEYAFSWGDILLTHSVLKNLFLQMAKAAVTEGIKTSKSAVSGLVKEFEAELDKWAVIPDVPQTPSSRSVSASQATLSVLCSAPASLGMYHLKGGVTSSLSSSPFEQPVEDIFDDLIKMAETEGQSVLDAVSTLKTKVIDCFDDLSITDIVKRILDVLTRTVLSSAENVLLTLLDVIESLLTGMVDALEAKIDFPVLSGLYKDLTGSDLSVLDLITLVLAIPVTLAYRDIAKGAPFGKDDAFTQALISATDIDGLRRAFVKPKGTAVFARVESVNLAQVDVPTVLSDPIELDEAHLKKFGLITGILSFVGGGALIYLTDLKRLRPDAALPVSWQRSLATLVCISNMAYLSPAYSTVINFVETSWYIKWNNVLTWLSIGESLIAIVAAPFEMADPAFAACESALKLVWNVPVGASIADHENTWRETYPSLIEESVGAFAFNAGGMLELPVELATRPIAKKGLINSQAALMGLYGGCFLGAGVRKFVI